MVRDKENQSWKRDSGSVGSTAQFIDEEMEVQRG